MPIYTAKCRVCENVEDYVRPVAQCMDVPHCCDQPMQKVILSAPMGYVENIAYTSPIDGRPITTKQARIEDLRRSGSRPWEGMDQEVKVARQRAAEEEKKADQAIEKAVVSAWQALPSEKRKVLESAT
jgi:hypothetical protein